MTRPQRVVAIVDKDSEVGNPGRARPIVRTVAFAILALTTFGAMAPRPASAQGAVVIVDGRGWGHGVGLAQDGAFWLAKSGQSAPQIIAFFYPGTKLGKRSGSIRVRVLDAGSLTLAFPQGGRIGRRKLTAGAHVRVRASGSTVQVDTGPSAGTLASVPAGEPNPAPDAAPAPDPPGAAAAAVPDAPAVPGPATSSVASNDQKVAFGPIGDRSHTFRLIVSVRAQTGADPSRVAATTPVGGSPAPAGVVATTPAASAAEPVPGPTTVADPAPPTSAADPPPTSAANPPAPDALTVTTAAPTSSPAVGTPGGASAAPVSPDSNAAAPVEPDPNADDPSDGGSTAAAGGAHQMRADAGTGVIEIIGGKRFRGALDLTASGGSIRVDNDVNVEDYLRGMGEVRDPRWPQAALRAQAIAARTYALRTIESRGEICKTDRCQVYLGAQAEYPEMDEAVRATAGQVVTYGGSLANIFYSASAGGVSATPEEGFGAGSSSPPYLVSRPYLSGDLREWTVQMPPSELGRRFGYRGTATGASVSRVGPSGRALEVTIDGSAGPKRIDGKTFQRTLRLRSTLLTVRAGVVAAGTELVNDTVPLSAASADDPVPAEADLGLLAGADPTGVSTTTAPLTPATVPATAVPTPPPPTTTIPVPDATVAVPPLAPAEQRTGTGGGLDLLLGGGALAVVGGVTVAALRWRRTADHD